MYIFNTYFSKPAPTHQAEPLVPCNEFRDQGMEACDRVVPLIAIS